MPDKEEVIMPYSPSRPCRHPGCPNVTKDRNGYCEKHTKDVKEKWNQQYHHWYMGKAWRKLRAWHLNEHPLCIMCEREGRTAAGVEVDHIIPHKGDWGLFTDPDNLQTLCLHHARQKTARD